MTIHTTMHMNSNETHTNSHIYTCSNAHTHKTLPSAFVDAHIYGPTTNDARQRARVCYYPPR